MFILPDSWEAASLLAKLLLYSGAFSIAGGCLCSWRYADANRAALSSNFFTIFVGSVLGFHGALLGFLVQVGLINASGVAGMFDWGMISLLLDTAQGDVAALRLLSFTIAGVSSALLLRQLQQGEMRFSTPQVRLLYILQIMALLGLAYSQTLLGHVSVLSDLAKAAIVLHFLAFACWIGCILPFLQLSRTLDIAILRDSLGRFGKHAIVILLLLFASGLLMLLELLNSPTELIDSPYGIALSLKLAFVLVILCVAALNKLVIVPGLLRSDSAAKLQASLRFEMGVALIILIATAYLSTIVGPVGHEM